MKKKVSRSKMGSLLFCAVLLAVALGLILWQTLGAEQGACAVLNYGENQELRFPLNKDGVYDVESNGYTIHIQVRNGEAAFVRSPCPDHLCEYFGWLSESGDMAVCLPAAAMLTIEAPD